MEVGGGVTDVVVVVGLVAETSWLPRLRYR
jgi:hypothetical protein